jgi:hypothetical protein
MYKGVSVCSSKQLTFLCLLEERNEVALLLTCFSLAGISESAASLLNITFFV